MYWKKCIIKICRALITLVNLSHQIKISLSLRDRANCTAKVHLESRLSFPKGEMDILNSLRMYRSITYPQDSKESRLPW